MSSIDLRPLIAALAPLVILACSSDATTGTTPTSPEKAQDGTTGDQSPGAPPAQTRPANVGTSDLPATGADADVAAWLAKGDYKTGSWKCEPAPHAARSPSPHGTNLICSNATLSGHGAGEFPVGSAGVKELYEGDKIIGRAMYRKLAVGGAEAWYWYEDMNGQVVANDLGSAGGAKSICVGCHAAAGSDADHSGHDFVYTQVK